MLNVYIALFLRNSRAMMEPLRMDGRGDDAAICSM